MKRELARKWKRLASIALAAALLMQLLLGVAPEPAAQAAPAPGHLLIHQVYGGGGKSDTPFTHSFIELYNPTGSPVDLTGWRVEYSSARSGSQHLGSTGGEWVSADLKGTIPAFTSYLIVGEAETTSAQVYAIEAIDLAWTDLYIDNKQYNVRLLDGTAVVDQVTVNEAGKDGIEGTAIPDDISKQKSVRRVHFQDTDNNAADFEVLEFEKAAAEFVEANRPRSLKDGGWGLVPDHLLIHQVYGGGGKDDTPFTHSFIELYNPTASAIDLTGWRVEYSSARSGSQHKGSTVGEWVYADVSGTVPAFTSYLIRGAAEDAPAAQTYTVGASDKDWTDRYIDNKQYNVRLLDGTTVVDQVTVSEAGKDGIEGTAIPEISKQKSVRRVHFQDTDNNAADFAVLEFEEAAAEFIAANRPRSLADGPWGLAPIPEGPGENDTVIKIFHTNDIHARAGFASGQVGFAQFKSFIDRTEADGKLVLDAGDIFHGQSIASLERGASIAELAKAVGYTAIAPGNHDFNYGWERLLELEDISGIPLLSANTTRNGDPLFANRTIVRDVDGVKVGIFGLTTPETAYKTNPNNVVGIDFGTNAEIVQAAKDAVQELQDAGADLVVALAHLGVDASSEMKSTDIAANVPGIDVIIDGHSHTNYPSGNVVNGVLIASAGEHFKNVGVVTIGYDKENQRRTSLTAKSYAASELTLEAYPVDAGVQALYEAISDRQEGIRSQVVGSTTIPLVGAREQVRGGETNLGRLITNAMLAESGAQIAITNGGGIRESIPAGDITTGQIVDVLPFGNFIVTKSLTGAQMKAALEQGMTFGAGSFPHFAGMEVAVTKYVGMSGSTTVERGRVQSITVNGEPMSMTDSYVVAMNDFMAAGGDGYTVLQAPPVLNDFAALDEALIDYIGTLSAADLAAVDAERRLKVEESVSKLSHLGSYSTGSSNKDGGVAEIVKYNPDNRKMYLVNGNEKQVDIVSLADLKNGANTFALDKRVDVSAMIPNFTFGDITSIDVSTKHRLVAVSVQEADYAKPGAVLLLDYDGNYVHHIPAGVQPDMITFTPNGDYVLTADEGEPRNGYGGSAVDPKGSVTIVDLRNGVTQAEATIVTFDAFDAQRDRLVENGVILKKGAAPSVDLEPEYVAVAPNGKTAYVSLQEANAIATLDIENRAFVDVKGLGFKNHNAAGNELDLFRDGTIEIVNQDVYGVYMPDAVAVAEIGGKTYVLTPNEGDAREWGSYANIRSATIGGKSFDALKNEEHDGLDPDKTYILGGRSFSIWDADTMELVYDSGSDFEKMTAEWYPDHFNVSNDNLTKDHRSSKKGPEPEDVKVTEIDGKFYAAVALERIGGVMMYDITDPAQPAFFDYINTRDYSAAIAGDVSPEGLDFVKAEDSPTGYPLLLAAHEVSGTVAVYQINQGYVEPVQAKPFELSVEKTTAAGMSSYQYALRKKEGAPSYSGDFYLVVQVYEGANGTTPGLVLIKKFADGSNVANEEIRIAQNKKVKIMVVSSPDGADGEVLADPYGAE